MGELLNIPDKATIKTNIRWFSSQKGINNRNTPKIPNSGWSSNTADNFFSFF